jgi:hypothetical protein
MNIMNQWKASLFLVGSDSSTSKSWSTFYCVANIIC